MKKIVAVLCLMTCLALLCGCKANAKREQLVHDTLRGSWVTQISCDESTRKDLLKRIDLYAEERALVSADGPEFVKVAVFADGEYQFRLDIQETKANVRAFYSAVLDDLYENRSQLDELYEGDLTAMDREEFRSYYGRLYGYTDVEAMLDAFAEGAFDYEGSAELESGTYTVTAEDRILCTALTGEASSGTLAFSYENDSLTLGFSDGEEIYSRLK